MGQKIQKKFLIILCQIVFLLRNPGKFHIWNLKYIKYYTPLLNRFYSNKTKKKFWVGYFNLLFTLMKGELNKEIKVLPRVAFYITTKCSLKCEGCSALIPYFNKREEQNLENIIKNIKTLENKVEKIQCIDFLGGEIFLYSKLSEILSYVTESPKIEIIEVSTNAMVDISEEVLKKLRNPKVLVLISDYGEINKKFIIKRIKEFRKYSIRYKIENVDYWWDFGIPKDYKRSEDDNNQYFKKCFASAECRTVYKGKLMVCSRGAWLLDNGYDISDFIDIEELALDEGKLYNFYYYPYSKLCNFCNYNYKKIQKAKQL